MVTPGSAIPIGSGDETSALLLMAREFYVRVEHIHSTQLAVGCTILVSVRYISYIHSVAGRHNFSNTHITVPVMS